MSLEIGMVTIDCAEPQHLAAFWSEALGVSIQGDYGDFVFLARPVDGGPVLGLQRVPEPRSGKNRVHVDLSGGSRVTEVQRLVGFGATVVARQDLSGAGRGSGPILDESTVPDTQDVVAEEAHCTIRRLAVPGPSSRDEIALDDWSDLECEGERAEHVLGFPDHRRQLSGSTDLTVGPVTDEVVRDQILRRAWTAVPQLAEPPPVQIMRGCRRHETSSPHHRVRSTALSRASRSPIVKRAPRDAARLVSMKIGL